jgi:pimeloyl-ACP methyl ester carboxylesterase
LGSKALSAFTSTRDNNGMSWRFAVVMLMNTAYMLTANLYAYAKPVSSLDEFYRILPAELNGAPGTLLRAAPIRINSFYRANAFRILYLSRNFKGEKVAVSGMVLVSTLPTRAGARPVVAWAHPTTGVARKCAPSLRSTPLAIPGAKDMIVKGYTVVATDYPGLGTSGPVPYLVGIGEAQAVLDSVKAIRDLPAAQAGNRYVLWGYSQGGHAALFAAGIARSYAPEVTLLGVAAAAPATNLGALLEADIDSVPGRILAAMTLLSWSRNFGYPLSGLVSADTVEILEHISRNCVDDLGGKLGALSAEQDLSKKFLNYNPNTHPPWRLLLADNSPLYQLITVPVFLAQGEHDTLVLPNVTAAFARALCRSSKNVVYRAIPNTDHSMAAERSAAEVVAWMDGRFYGKQAATSCGMITRRPE